MNNELKFIHITKTGGTSIEDIGLLNGVMWGRHDKLLKECNIPWHLPLKLYKKNIYHTEILFTVVRNPYERIVSECFCKWGSRFKKNDLLTIDDFNEYIHDRVSKVSNGDFFHFVPQSEYTHDNDGKQIIHHILKFENLKEEFNNLMKLYSVNINLTMHVNKSVKLFNVDDINEINIILINDVYNKDFELYNYKKIVK
jgi:hypothetical protein